MRKLLFAFLLLFAFIFKVSGQTQPSVLPSPKSDSGFAQYNWIRALNGGIIFPSRDTLFTPTYIGSVIFWRNPSSDTALWVYASTTGRRWYRVVTLNSSVATGTVTSVGTNNGTGITGGTITATGTLSIDTLNISTRLWRQKGIDSTIGLIALKVNISDTSSMLVPYLRKSDTLTMLLPYLRKTDTASMLSPYALKSSGNDFIRNQTGSNLSAQTAKFWVTDSIRTSGIGLALRWAAAGSTTSASLLGNNTGTGLGLSVTSTSNYAAEITNNSTTNSTLRVIQNGSNNITSFENGFGFGVKIDTSANIILNNNASSGNTGTISLPSISANRIYTLPNASGTIALTSDISSRISDSLGNLVRLKAGTSAGIGVYANNWTHVAQFGDGGGSGTTLYGGLNGTTITASGAITGGSIVRSGGTSSQFLKADGSVDGSTYLTQTTGDARYLQLTGGTLTGTLNGTNAVFSGNVESDFSISDYVSITQGVTAYGGLSRSGTWEGGADANLGLFATTGRSLKFYTNGSGTAGMTLSTTNQLTLTGALSGTSAGFTVNNATATPLTFYNNLLGYTQIKSTFSSSTDAYSAGIRFLKEATGGNFGSSIGFLTELDQASQNYDYAMYIKNRNVGIGTVSPKSYTGYTTVTIGNSSATGGVITFQGAYNSGNGAELFQNGSGNFLFNINSSLTAGQITSAGRWLFGTTTDDGSSIGQFAGDILLTKAGNLNLVVKTTSNNTPYLSLSRNSGGNGIFGAYVNSSSETIFENQNGTFATFATTGAATFSSSVTASNYTAFIANSNNYAHVLNRSNTSYFVGTSYRTNSSARWFVGLRETSDDNYRIYNEGIGQDVLLLNYSTNTATFISNVTAKTYSENVVSVSGAYTVASDVGTVFASSNTYTITLPSASGNTGRIITIKRTSSGLGTSITISGVTLGTSENGGSLPCHAAAVYRSDGTNWYCISYHAGGCN